MFPVASKILEAKTVRKPMSSSRKVLCVLVTLLAGWSANAQQITGSIRGTVVDPSGAVVQKASVSARQTETGLTRTTTTGRDGAYILLELPVGHYQLQVEATGFQSYAQEGISLSVNETATVPVHLVIGSKAQKVQVNADAQLIQDTVTSLGKVVQEREILDLPLNGRNFTQLGTLQPGVVPLTPGLREAGGSIRQGQSFAVNGQRPESNNFLIDGANNFNGVDGGFVLKPPVDAVTEFRILTHNAPAEFGSSLGSTTNIITKSGTNRVHGAVYEFLRNDVFDATRYFATTTEPLKQNQFGGAIGGPIVKDKTFFFLFYEGFRNREGETQGSTVPSVRQRQGDFGELCDASHGESFDAGGFCSNPDHQLLLLVTSPAPTPLPFNQLPPPFISTFSQSLLNLFPLPNSGPNTFTSTVTKHDDFDQGGVRIDHYLTPNDTLTFRYMINDGTRLDPLSPAGASVPGFPVTEDQRSQNFVATETHTFTPSIVGVFRFSFLRNKFLFGERTDSNSPSSLGFNYDPSLEIAAGTPHLIVSGYTTVGAPITGPRRTYENAYDYSGSLSWVRGKHEFKFGGGFQHQHINMLQGIATNGFFVFAPFPISDPFASFMIGQPVFFLQGRGDFGREINGKSLNGYVQDSFKASKRLTLNLGLRYDLVSPYTEERNRMTLWVPGRQSTVFPDAPEGLLYPGDAGVPRGLIPTFKKAFAPRVGIAWDPTGSSNWLITSAYGLFYEPYYTGQGGPLQSPISAPPFLQTEQISLTPDSPLDFQNPYGGPPPAPNTFATPLTNLTLAPNLPLPYAQDWDINVQRSLGRDVLLEVGYVGTKGTKLPRFIEANPTVYIPGQTTADNVDQRRIHSGCGLNDPESDCEFASTGLITGIANSSYNALEASLRKRFSHGLSFLASYTWSHAIDDVSSFNIAGSSSIQVAGENDLAQDPRNLAAERGSSLFDARHRLVFSYQWSLPFFEHLQGASKTVLGGWQLNGIVTGMSGTPFTVFDSRDNSFQGGAPEITGFSANRPNLVAGQNPNNGPRQVNDWLNVAAFTRVPQDGTLPTQQFGTAGRNIAVGPRYFNWDFGTSKNFRLTETKDLQFRAEIFNLLNHANFHIPNSDISSPTFNQILEAEPARLVQFALKFLF
jgi:Carboxypeptidase regulatory-like domain